MDKDISNENNIIQFPKSKRKNQEQDTLGKVGDILGKAKPVKKKNTKRKKEKSSMSIKGNNNTQIAGDNFVMVGYLAPVKNIIRKEFTPGPEHISSEQAKEIKDTVDNLVKKEVAGGNTIGRAYSRWWSTVKNRYKVGSYKEIPVHLGDEAISWIKQQSAMKRTKIRRTNNPMWRNELYGAIWARSKNLKLSKGEVYNIVYERMGKRVSSLKQLGEQNLKKLYSIIMSM